MKKLFLILSTAFLSFSTIQNEKVLFVGDSLTCYAGGWQDQVAKKLGYKYDNISKGGKRTSWMLATLTMHLGSKRNYKKVFIYGGANDAFSYVSLEGAVTNVQNMVDLCIENKMEPIVVLGYDPYKVMVNTPYKKDIAEFHKARYVKLQAMLKQHLVNCKIIEVCTTVTDANAHDDIHLGASGHKLFADWVLKELSK